MSLLLVFLPNLQMGGSPAGAVAEVAVTKGGGPSKFRLQMIKKDDEEVLALIMWLRSRGIKL